MGSYPPAECVWGVLDCGGVGVEGRSALRWLRYCRVQSSPRGRLRVGRASRAPALFRPCCGSARDLLWSNSFPRTGFSGVCSLGSARASEASTVLGVSRSNYFEPVLSEACLFEDSLPG